MRVEFENLATAAATVTTHAMRLSRVTGYFNGAADRWLQLHNSKTTPAAAAVPVRSWPLYATAPFDQNFQNDAIDLSVGCTFVVSTTQTTYTASADTLSLYVNGIASFDDTGTSIEGGYGTDNNPLAVWSNANGPKRLVRLEVTDVNGNGPGYVQVHAKDAITLGDVPLVSIPIEFNGSVDLFFGDGLLTQIITSLGVKHDACTVEVSATAGTYTQIADASFAIRATYK